MNESMNDGRASGVGRLSGRTFIQYLHTGEYMVCPDEKRV